MIFLGTSQLVRAIGGIVIIYIEEFQIRAMETSQYSLHQWCWYVDDNEMSW